MTQLSKTRSAIYHFYPGILITLGFIVLAPIGISYGYPPQFGMLLSIIVVALPVIFVHLMKAKQQEGLKKIADLNELKTRLPLGKLILYAFGLAVLAFIIWGITQPADIYISKHFFGWLPTWFTVQSLAGCSHDKIKITLLLNLLLNGLLAPYAEEVYFRGYLLPRMQSWGKYSFMFNTIFFSLYHLWQPYVYLTLMLALLPMVYMVYRTRDIRLGILTHSLLNIIGAILSFALLNGK